MTTPAAHVRQPKRMVGRKMQPASCSCGVPWPCAVAAGEERWSALRKHLEEQAAIEQDVADDMSEGADEQRWRDACGHWGAAEALRGLIKYLDHEGET